VPAENRLSFAGVSLALLQSIRAVITERSKSLNQITGDYPLEWDLLRKATMPSTVKPAAQTASMTSDVAIKSWATR
jgi:hypothetical protein